MGQRIEHSKWLRTALTAILVAASCGTASLAGEPGDRAKVDEGVVVALPALNPGDLQSQSGGAFWSPPADLGSRELSDRQMAIILWDDHKRTRVPAGAQPNQGVSMVNGRFQ